MASSVLGAITLVCLGMCLLPVAHSFASTFAVISDIHLNIFYNATFPASAKCVSFGNGSVLPRPPAGARIAQFGCDTSPQLFYLTMQSLKRIVQEVEPEFLIVLGDFVPHLIPMWQAYYSATQTMVNQLMVDIINQVSSVLVQLQIPVYPMLGNNDVYPDYYQPGGGNQAWLKRLAKTWAAFLGPATGGVNASATFSLGGYYRVDVPNSNATILVLNTNAFSSGNDIVNCTSYPDPDNVFAWLAAQLAAIEPLNRSAWICGHISPSLNHYNFQPNWQTCYEDRYFSIVANYSHIIAAQIFGHEHVDLFRATNATAPLILQSSISPIYGDFPNFRIYNTSSALDFREYYWSGVNSSAPPDSYEVLFESALEEYNLTSLSSEQVEGLVARLESNSTLFSLYWTNTVARSPELPVCNSTCVAMELCSTLHCDLPSYTGCIKSYIS